MALNLPNAFTEPCIAEEFRYNIYHLRVRIYQNLPNLISTLRIAAVPIMVAVFWIPRWGAGGTAVLFGLASLSDFFDGYLARRYGLVSRFGEFIDPVADKFLVISALILLLASPILLVPRWLLALVAMTIIMCDTTVSSLRAWMATAGYDQVLRVTIWGKIKAAVQMTSLFFLLAAGSITDPWLAATVSFAGMAMLLMGCAVAVCSTLNYLNVARRRSKF